MKEKMKEKSRIFGLLLYKNFLVRKRQWKVAVFVEILSPILIFLIAQVTRDFVAISPEKFENNSYYEIKNKSEMIAKISYTIDVYFVPENRFTRTLMEKTRNCLKFPDKIIGFNTEEEMLKRYTLHQTQSPESIVIAIVFDENYVNVSSKHLGYTIRTSSAIPNILYKGKGSFGSTSEQAFIVDIPFVQFQLCLDESFIKMKASSPAFKSQISIQQMPQRPYVQSHESDEILRTSYVTFAGLAFLFPLIVEVVFPANEKSDGTNVLMAMNGVPTYLNLLSWLVSGLLLSFIYVSVLIGMFSYSFTDKVNSYLYYGNTLIFWLMLILHIGHLLTFGMHIAAYFSNPLFLYFGILLLIIGSNLIIQNVKGDLQAAFPYLGILFPNIILGRAFEEVNIHENMLTGIHWSNIFLVGDTVYKRAGSMGMLMIFTIIGTIFHFTMTIYIYAVHPGKYGVKKYPLYFLKFEKGKNRINSDDERDDYEFDSIGNKPFESVPENVYIPGIQIRNLKKDYYTDLFRKSKIQALRGISVDFYKGQITALLGHNGAGKTTMMSILTGMISPTTGTIFINGKNIKDGSQEIINDVGLCPQENMLFPFLSVFEQIIFFAKLKGKNKKKKEIEINVNNILQKLKLFDKRNALPKNLSGGQKRRVCLAMALAGDSSTLILDEPTSGLDPESKRDIWDIILKMRGQKTVLISTHNMEEADILGDRIAIVHMGRLKSYGTTMFLKKFLGKGNIEVTLSIESWCDPKKIISEFGSGGQILNTDGGKIVLSVPNTSNLPDSLDKLESKKHKLGITGMSVSLITLEQVFLKVTRENEDDTDSSEPFISSPSKLKGHALFIQSIVALLKKKGTYTWHNKIITCAIILFPAIFTLLMSLSFPSFPGKDSTNKVIKLDMYKQPEAYYKSDNKLIGQKYKLVTEEYNGKATEVTNDSLTDAMLELGRMDLTTFRYHLIAAAEFNNTGDDILANAFFSGHTLFSIPITANLLSNSLLKSFAGDEYSISVSAHQLPDSLESTALPEVNFLTYIIVGYFCIVLFIIITFFVIHPHAETITNVKHLQRMTGVSGFTYWGTMFIYDFAIFLVSIFLIAIAYIVMDCITGRRLFEGTEILIIVLILVLFAINALPIVYIFSFIKKPLTNVISYMNFVYLLIIPELMMHGMALGMKHMKYIRILRSIQRRIFLFIPYISFLHGKMSIFNTAFQNDRCRTLPNILQSVVCVKKDICCGLECYDGKCKKSLSYFENFEKDMSLEESIIHLCITPILYFGILAILEYKLIHKMLARRRETGYKIMEDPYDEQVKQEKHNVASEITKVRNHYNVKATTKTAKSTKIQVNGNASVEENNALSNSNSPDNYLFFVYELSKRFGKVLAVEEVSFGVKQHECFGLLGVNGAGKSTTFKMITGEILPDNGVMYLGNQDYYKNKKNYFSQMGYCPQDDAMISCLTAYDHLRLFSRLRGIRESQVNAEVKKWIDRLNLNICALQPCKTYSGGNKRRLNVAMALIGDPNLALLDEPTTGVDPAARRSLWKVIQSCQSTGQAFILSTHSMEECEVLCNRLVIMVNGQLVCIGPSQELKQRFEAGCDIQMKLNPEKSSNEIESIKADVELALDCELVDENSAFLMYHVITKTSWRKMYDVMNELKRKYSCIDDFSIFSSSLEQLFLLFARTAKPSNRRVHN